MFKQVNIVLAYNVVNEKDALLRVNTKYFQGFQQCKINVLLLFIFNKLANAFGTKQPCRAQVIPMTPVRSQAFEASKAF